MSTVSQLLEESRCLVIKVGSSLLIGEDDRVREDWLRTLAYDISDLRRRGQCYPGREGVRKMKSLVGH